jgi:hypothetical protein
MHYRVTKQFARGPETTLQSFLKREAAAAFIMEKLADDARFKVETTYRIYDDLDEVLKEYTLADAVQTSSSGSQGSAGSAGKSQSFNPTPFNMTPMPTGMPRSWIKDEDEDDKKK